MRGKIPEDQLRRLIHGIGATLGIEAFVWLTDIAGLPREEAAAVIRSNAIWTPAGRHRRRRQPPSDR